MSWWQRVLPPTKLERDLVWQCVLSAFATGTFLTGTAVYFTRIVGLSGAEVGLGMSIAAVVTLVLQLPMGRLADRLPSPGRAGPGSHRNALTTGRRSRAGWWAFPVASRTWGLCWPGTPPGGCRQPAAMARPARSPLARPRCDRSCGRLRRGSHGQRRAKSRNGGPGKQSQQYRAHGRDSRQGA